MDNKIFTHLGLFEGIGGFSLAARWMGWHTVAYSEIDKYCLKVLNKNFPEAKSLGDIKEINFKDYENNIDILTGGFPCQPFSVAGKRKGTDDNRYLWPQMLRAIREIKPTYIVGENVHGIVNWNEGMVFEQVFLDLENEGYEVEAFVLPACGVNAPHRRNRVWFIAYCEHKRVRWGQQQQESEQEEIKSFENTNSLRCDSIEWKSKPEVWGFRKFSAGDNEWLYSKQDASDTSSTGQQMCKNRQGEKQFRRGSSWDIWDEWTTESPICGVGNGIPNRVDRIKGLGNAIVPQLAYQIYLSIQDFEKYKHGRKRL